MTDDARLLPRDRIETVEGFGGADRAVGYVYRPSTIDGVRDVFAAARKHGVPVALRGSGRSYGDAAYLS